jgi:hypothetical protein
VSVIFLTSVSGSPGVTSAAVGLALAWPRPIMLVEADISKPSGILPGYLRGQMDHSRGLTALSVLHQRGQVTPRAMWDQSVRLGKDRFFVAGFSHVSAAAGAGASFWNTIGTTITAIATQGADVLVDAGRFNIHDDRSALMQHADLVALVAHPTLPHIAAIAARRRDFTETLTHVGRDDSIGLLLVDSPIESFRDTEITKAVHLPILCRVVNNPRTAAVYSLGAEPTPKTRKSALTRDLTLLPNVLEQIIGERRNKLGVPHLEEATA